MRDIFKDNKLPPTFDPKSGLRWHMLSNIKDDMGIIELVAATTVDGIGVIARWCRQEDRGWRVSAIDSESTRGMQEITNFGEGECVPLEPPTVFDDITQWRI